MDRSEIRNSLAALAARVKNIVGKACGRTAIALRAAYYVALRTMRTAAHFLGLCIVTVLGLGVAAMLLFIPLLKERVAGYPNPDLVSLGIAGAIGAMIVLATTLAVVPVQRAIESFSPLVRTRYAHDFVIKLIYVALAFSCIISFAMPVLRLPSTVSLPLQFLVLAVSLDLIRWHHRRVCFLLEPREAILILEKETRSFIRHAQRRIAKMAAKARKHLPPADEETTPEQEQTATESAFYHAFGGCRGRIERGCGELTQVGVKATTRHEVYTVQSCTVALSTIAIEYLNARKENIVLYPFDLFTVSSDTDRILVLVYEDLLIIARAAARQKNDTMCAHVVKALRVVAVHTANLGSTVFQDEYSAPLTSLPLGYLGQCVKCSEAMDLQEVPWQAIDELRNLSSRCRENIRICDVHLHVLSEIKGIAARALIRRQGHIANKAVKTIMQIGRDLLVRKHFERLRFYSRLLQEIEPLVPLLVANEAPGFSISDEFAPYSLGCDCSIGYTVSAAQDLIKPDPDRGWINPYRDFMEINETIYRHLRTIAQNYDLQGSRVFWDINDAVKRIADVYDGISRVELATSNPSHTTELMTQIGWYESVLWVAFDNKPQVLSSAAECACDTLAWVGMRFTGTDHTKIPETSIADIQSVVESYYDKTQGPDKYVIADLCMRIWYVRKFAEHAHVAHIVAKADESIQAIEKKLGTSWADVDGVLELRKDQLARKLGQYDELVDLWDPRGYLKNAIQQGD